MGIETKSFGMMLDELLTVSQKLFHLQEIVMDENATDKEVADNFRKIQTLNVRRNLLINAIDKIIDENSFSTTLKTYK
jgi:hypothetical protein